MVNISIGAAIAFLPLFIKVAEYDMSRVSKDNLLVILLALFSFMLPKKERSLPVVGWMMLAYGLCFLVFNQWTPLSISVQYQTFYIASGLIFFCSFFEKHDERSVTHILNGMAIGCIIQSVITIVTWAGYPIYFEVIKLIVNAERSVGTNYNGVGSLGQSNLLSAYLALTTISLFRKRLLFLLPIPLAALLIANSMMGYATLAAAICFYLNLKLNLINKLYFYALASFGMITVYFTGLNGHDTARFSSWKTIFERMDSSHILIGRGPGWFFDHPVVTPFNEIMKQEHNEFISCVNIFGVIGLAFVFAMAPALMRAKSLLWQSIVFAGFINCYGNFTLHQSSTALILIVATAICLAEGRKYVVNVER